MGGRMATDSRVPNYRIGSEPNRFCEKGLAVEQVRDRRDMLERLADVCEEQGRKGEAAELRKQAKRSAAVAATRVTKPKIGRNEPCPCGSGKKFKKCCGA